MKRLLLIAAVFVSVQSFGQVKILPAGMYPIVPQIQVGDSVITQEKIAAWWLSGGGTGSNWNLVGDDINYVDGSVLIGTTSANGAKFRVNGFSDLGLGVNKIVYSDSSNILSGIDAPVVMTKPVLGYLNGQYVFTEDSTGGGGSSVGAFDDLSDVTWTSPQNNDVPVYDSSLGAIVNRPAVMFNATGLQDGMYSRYDSTNNEWEGAFLPSGSVAPYTDDYNLKVNSVSGLIQTNKESTALVISAGATTFDASNGFNRYVTLDQNTTITFTNFQDGQYLTLAAIQDATGGRTLTLPGGTKTSGTLTTTANAHNILCFANIGGTIYCIIKLFQ